MSDIITNLPFEEINFIQGFLQVSVACLKDTADKFGRIPSPRLEQTDIPLDCRTPADCPSAS